MDSRNYFKSDDDKAAILSITDKLWPMLKAAMSTHDSLVFFCIGTDRSTGDALGPLVGTQLKDMKYPDVFSYGTVEDPIHARNLEEVLTKVKTDHPKCYIIAIDASLGILDHVGCITLGHGPIHPGAGLKKQLPEVGDMHITGIVNTGGFMDFLVLQSTRLSVVMKMADIIAKSIYRAIYESKNNDILLPKKRNWKFKVFRTLLRKKKKQRVCS